MVVYLTAILEIQGLSLTAGSCVYHDSHCDSSIWLAVSTLLQRLGRRSLPPFMSNVSISFHAEYLINVSGNVDGCSLPEASHSKLVGLF